MPDKLLTIDEVADILSVSVTTLRSKHFRRRVGLNSIRIGRSLRFTKQELVDFISRNTDMPCDSQVMPVE